MVGKIWPMKMPARPVVQSEKNALAYFSCRLQAGSTNYLDRILCICISELQDLGRLGKTWKDLGRFGKTWEDMGSRED